MIKYIQKYIPKNLSKYIQENIINIIIFISVAYIVWINYGKKKLITIKLSNGETHSVRDMPDKKQAAKVMDEIKRRLKLLSTSVKDIDNGLLTERFKTTEIRETDLTESGTSYSVDKGKELSICLRNKDTKEIHQINILMFVCIHEMAHLMSKSYGHNAEFNKNFKILLEKAISLGIYSNKDYSKENVEYCGMTIDNNPLF